MLAGVLFVEAYVNAEFHPDHSESGGKQATVPQAVIDGGPIIDTRNNQVHSYALPDKTIALTFDDGPDPEWTPQIMEVLRKHNVNATFFVVGTQVTRHADIVAELARGGDEIGIHSFTHPRLDQLTQWQRELEYSQTQLAVVKATGQKSALLRLPYSSSADAIDDANWPLIKDAGRLGYLSIMTDTDSRDWSLPGVDKIVAGATPEGAKGSIVLMHDAGGDRKQTVEALDKFIPMMQQRGYSFTTVSGGLTKALAGQSIALEAPATPTDQRRAFALVTAVTVADSIMELLRVLFLIVGILTIARTVALFLLAGRHARRRRAKTWQWGPPVTEPVSVIVPAYNEKEGIEAAVRSLASGDHPGGIEVVVVDDGSTDNTSELVQALQLPNVRVVRIPNGGKPNALNTGVALAKHDIIVMVDGDTVFEPDSVRHLVQPFADPSVGAVAGNVKVGNRKSIVARWQHIEYVIGFNLDRRLYDILQVMPTIPGAIGAFRRQALRDIGGISHDTLAEDTDATMALCRTGWRVVYEERARAWTEAPSTLRQLWLQRYRWSYGTMQAMWKHRRSIVDSGPSGRFGRVGLPFIAFFGIALPLLAPLIDILLVYGLFFSSWKITTAAWLAMFTMQLVTAIVAFRLDKEKLRPLWVLPLQQFVYRQLMYIVLIQSMGTALTGARLRWHKLHRAGSAGASAPFPSQAATSPAASAPETSPLGAASALGASPLGASSAAASAPGMSPLGAASASALGASPLGASSAAGSAPGMSPLSTASASPLGASSLAASSAGASSPASRLDASPMASSAASPAAAGVAARAGSPVGSQDVASFGSGAGSSGMPRNAAPFGSRTGSPGVSRDGASFGSPGGFGSPAGLSGIARDAASVASRDAVPVGSRGGASIYGSAAPAADEAPMVGDGFASVSRDVTASARGDEHNVTASARRDEHDVTASARGDEPDVTASARGDEPDVPHGLYGLGDGDGGGSSRGVARVPNASSPGHRVSEHTAVLYAVSHSSVLRSTAAERDGGED
ncbi:bifunctional polysaccharide deacetylase/glycosyltransferase family 2 protein [Dactylosporangium sp. CS-033363]|uniref:bifunctional polysaccharide deacetylase/glycosyltransferase family 2 protein n=1 Tax=Dactylosporangium sp. CS-033363 TaxID=3239935 RepID=UPI003D910729